MSNLARLWKEEEIQAVKEALNAEDTDYSSYVSSLFESLKSGFSSSPSAEDAQLEKIGTVAGGILGILITAGVLITSPLALQILDTAIDAVGTYEEYKERWQNDPETSYYTENIKKKHNILLGDAICYGSSVGEFISRNSDGSYDFYSVFKPEFVNKHLARAINHGKSIPENIIFSEDNETFDFSKLSYFEDFNVNRLLGRALNYQVDEKHRVVEKFPISEENQSEQYDFRKMFRYHAVNSEDFKLYLTTELKSISSFFTVNCNNFEGQ